MSDGYLLVEPLMRPRAIIVVDIIAQHTPQMAFAEDEQPIQALGADPTFGIGIGVGCSKRRMDDMDICSLKDSIKGWGELGVVVVNQKADDWLSAFQAPCDLSGLLGHPAGIRMDC